MGLTAKADRISATKTQLAIFSSHPAWVPAEEK